MAVKTLITTINAANAGRVDLVIRELSGASRSQIRGIVDHNCVSINGQLCDDFTASVAAGDVVAVRFDPNQRYHEKKTAREDRMFSIAFEDDHLIVVNKSAGTLTVPTDRHEKNTLVQRVSVYLQHSNQKQQRAWLVHRLDREVSGLLIFGKRKTIADQLIEQFRKHKPLRIYAAIVAGSLSKDGTFRSHLATGKNLDRYVAPPSSQTESAITHYRVLRSLEDTTLVEAILETGKRNQIRVHFANAGHPILGDPRYCPKQSNHPRWPHKRIALHARSLGIEHPISREEIKFDSPLPSEMEKFLAGSH